MTGRSDACLLCVASASWLCVALLLRNTGSVQRRDAVASAAIKDDLSPFSSTRLLPPRRRHRAMPRTVPYTPRRVVSRPSSCRLERSCDFADDRKGRAGRGRRQMGVSENGPRDEREPLARTL
ncbi:hypothetical protein MTO96_008526 [Rhipicephalus appendiculatus]